MPKELEHEVQKAICKYLDLKKIFYFAVPNGGHRHIKVASKLKSEGVKAGIPDLCILKDGRAYFIEVKRPKTVDSPKGRVTKNQVEVFGKITDQGCKVEVAYSVQDVEEILRSWRIFD
jgi:hypothetical protein